eukprot:6198061-Pleurochrysis_carterae.AAC.1
MPEANRTGWYATPVHSRAVGENTSIRLDKGLRALRLQGRLTICRAHAFPRRRYLKEHERKYGKVLRSDGGVAEMTGLPRLCAVGATQEASNGDVRGAAGAC